MLTKPFSVSALAHAFNYTEDVAFLYVLVTFIAALAYGPVAIASVIALRRLSKRICSSRPAKILFLVVLAQFICQTIAMLFTMVTYLAFWHITRFNEDSSGTANHDETLYNWYFGIGTVSGFAQIVLISLANGVVVWRAWVFYNEIKPIQWLLFASWVVDVCFRLVWWCFRTNDGIQALLAPSYQGLDDHLTQIISAVSSFSSFGVNTIATGLIAYRAWSHKAMLKSSSLGSQSFTSKSSPYQALLILVEWGVFLCGFQLFNAILGTVYTKHVVGDARYIIIKAIGVLLLMFIDAHPALLALVLYQRRSVTDSSIFTTELEYSEDNYEQGRRRREAGFTLTPVRFAGASSIGSSTYNEEERDSISGEKKVPHKAIV
ncbi:hypothetical protein DL96DRAFT_1741835 [Flagelloscypha sp. PMI_526]|nr:hypothetical protein DL96DRAFT_1741835 [Flagelloscypha sp. PMI_526]